MGIAKIIGILLIAAGALGLTYGGFTYTKENVVQLSGSVATSGERVKAAELARSVEGVRSVRNDLQLK